MADAELEGFKTDIDLREFAASVGFELSVRDSWRGSAVMTRCEADKIIITRSSDGHYVYFSVKESHSGSVIDLAQRYVNRNFGEVRKALRRWKGGSEVPAPPIRWPVLEKTNRDFERVEREWHAADAYVSHGWLEHTRGIPATLLHAPRFESCLKIDARGNVLFAHMNVGQRLCGYERKNDGFTGFAAGGEKGLACSRDFAGDARLVLAESFIDMLSYAALFPEPLARYRSFAGGLNGKQPELIRAHILDLPRGSEIVAATDGDDAGIRFAETIQALSDGYSVRAERVRVPLRWPRVRARNGAASRRAHHSRFRTASYFMG